MGNLAQAEVHPAKRVFISYRHRGDDERLAQAIYEAFRERHQVYIDKTNLVGTDWGARISSEINRADYLIACLSGEALRSEMVIEEIRMAHLLAAHKGAPEILPVRVRYEEPYPYPISVWLNHLQWVGWEGDDCTEKVIKELDLAMRGESWGLAGGEKPGSGGEFRLDIPLPSAQPRLREGPMSVDSPYYVPRHSDEIALGEVDNPQVTMSIQGPRQLGKSSLLVRVVDRALDIGKEVIFIDFQLLDQPTLSESARFFRWFARTISSEMGLPDESERYWEQQLPEPQKCTMCMKQILRKLGKHVLLALDEVDKIYGCAFQSDFFAMIRHWHNRRATDPLMRKLDLALVTATEPHLLIEGNQSPFNVGTTIKMKEFNPEEVKKLNSFYMNPLNDSQLLELTKLVGGHPYLLRKSIYLVADKQIGFPELLEQAHEEQGPFGDHLRYYSRKLAGRPELIEGMRAIVRGTQSARSDIIPRLQAAGLIRTQGGKAYPRCELYARYFERIVL